MGSDYKNKIDNNVNRSLFYLYLKQDNKFFNILLIYHINTKCKLLIQSWCLQYDYLSFF